MTLTPTTDGSSQPEVAEESVADVALKTYTLFFLVSAILLGVLLLGSLRKATRICLSGTHKLGERGDPRLPVTLFQSPSILTTLQDRYDKNRSLRSISTLRDDYSTTHDIEYVREIRVNRYLDLSLVDDRSEEQHPADDQARSAVSDQEGNDCNETQISVDDGHSTQCEIELHDMTKPDHPDLNESDPEQIKVADSDLTYVNLSAPDESGSTNADKTVNSSPDHTGDISPEQDDEAIHDKDDVADQNDSDYLTIGKHSTISEDSTWSMVNDNVPLCSEAPSGSVQHGRYKKNVGQKGNSGFCAGSTSAKLSKRISKQT